MLKVRALLALTQHLQHQSQLQLLLPKRNPIRPPVNLLNQVNRLKNNLPFIASLTVLEIAHTEVQPLALIRLTAQFWSRPMGEWIKTLADSCPELL